MLPGRVGHLRLPPAPVHRRAQPDDLAGAEAQADGLRGIDGGAAVAADAVAEVLAPPGVPEHPLGLRGLAGGFGPGLVHAGDEARQGLLGRLSHGGETPWR